MGLSQEQRGWREVRLQAAFSDGQKRIDILLRAAVMRSTAASTACSRDNWISPISHQMAGWNQNTARTNFFDHRGCPIGAADMHQLVAGDGLLRALRSREEFRRQQNRRFAESERDGTGYFGWIDRPLGRIFWFSSVFKTRGGGARTRRVSTIVAEAAHSQRQPV